MKNANVPKDTQCHVRQREKEDMRGKDKTFDVAVVENITSGNWAAIHSIYTKNKKL
jgi:hypothetical protein